MDKYDGDNWDKFQQSGKISDYLIYCGYIEKGNDLSQNAGVGAFKNANQDERSYPKTT